MPWFLHDWDLRHERVNGLNELNVNKKDIRNTSMLSLTLNVHHTLMRTFIINFEGIFSRWVKFIYYQTLPQVIFNSIIRLLVRIKFHSFFRSKIVVLVVKI